MYGIIVIDGNGKRSTLNGTYKTFNDAEYVALRSGYPHYIITFTKNGTTVFVLNTEEL